MFIIRCVKAEQTETKRFGLFRIEDPFYGLGQSVRLEGDFVAGQEYVLTINAIPKEEDYNA